jgi:hypothetical protein
VKIAKARSDRMSKPLPAIHHVADVILVPDEDSRIGNVTGGRKLARHNFMADRIRTAWKVQVARAHRLAPDRPG